MRTDHPTIARHASRTPPAPIPVLSTEELRAIALAAGADDVGFVDLDDPDLADQRDEIVTAFPRARALISFVQRMNRDNIRSPYRSISNLEFHHASDDTNETARTIVTELEKRGIGAINGGAIGFPMETSRWPGKIWVVSHKPLAVAAGLGRIGIHRNVIHPKFGNFILLGTVIVDRPIARYAEKLDYNPCLECKLCVAACPTGAISPDGAFNFAACYIHNYRDFMGGFVDWVERLADSKDRFAYRERVSDPDTVSMWQSLSFGPNYKAAYCLAVCPAGEDVIGPYLDDKKSFMAEIVRPLQDKPETIYVSDNSDATAYVAKRFPHKTIRKVGSGLRPSTAAGFLRTIPILFQPEQSSGLDATYHFRFSGNKKLSMQLW